MRRFRAAKFQIGLLLPLVFLLSCSSEDYVDRGSMAPLFTLPTLAGDTTFSLADTRGKVVLLNFWASWCGPCVSEMPALERLHQTLSDDDFVIVAVSVGEEPDTVQTFVDTYGITFTVLVDRDRTVGTSYQSFQFPETFFIDRSGKVVVPRIAGAREWDQEVWLEAIREMMASPKTEQ